jgi:hypothetical protein
MPPRLSSAPEEKKMDPTEAASQFSDSIQGDFYSDIENADEADALYGQWKAEMDKQSFKSREEMEQYGERLRDRLIREYEQKTCGCD